MYALTSVETQRLQNGHYLFLARNQGAGAYNLFTFDPVSKTIDKFSSSPNLPSSIMLACYPVVNAAREKAYLLTTDSPSGSFVNVRLYTVDSTTGKRNDPAGSFPLTSTFINEFGLTLLADGRLLLAGGAEIVGFDWQALRKTWFINPNTTQTVGSVMMLLLLD